jgi:thiol:disulfide interchange protein/DsbC/DsbD-like thiol-disulfide interchange protein
MSFSLSYLKQFLRLASLLPLAGGTVCFFLAFVSIVQAKIELPQSNGAKKVEAVEVQLVTNFDGPAPPGEVLLLGLVVKHDPHWHTYWRNPGDSGLPTEISVNAPSGWNVGPIRWPAPQRIPIGPLVNYGFENVIVLPMPITADSTGKNRGTATFSAKVQWLMCKDVCIPGEAQVSVDLDLGQSNALKVGKPTAFKTLFDEMERRTPKFEKQAVHAAKGNTLSIQIALSADEFSTLSAMHAKLADGSAKLAGDTFSFFPYAADVVPAPAAQGAYLIPAAGSNPAAIRFDITNAALNGVAQTSTPLNGAIDGLLKLDNVYFEVNSRMATDAQLQTAGTLLSDGVLTQDKLKVASSADFAKGAVSISQSLWWSIAFAFVGGLILNLMPCVFPVLGLKVLGFAAHGKNTSAQRALAAAFFSLGVVGSFLALALVMTLLQNAGESVGWGFQLQSPWFVIAMAFLFTLIGLNLSGVFEVGVGLTRINSSTTKNNSPLAEFGSGVLAVLVATPCTAPFMGAALGATLSQSPVEKFAVFTALGIGMALPYGLLTLLPAASRFLPKPGAWMETFKQCLAFPMFATVVWLVWVLGQQTNLDAVFVAMLALVVLALGAWCFGRWQSEILLRGAASGKALAWLSALAVSVLVVGYCAKEVSQTDASSLSDLGEKHGASNTWAPWSESAVKQALAQNKPVLVDFTAAWCVSCQVNKKVVFETEQAKKFFEQKRVVLLRADWTRRDAAITSELAKYGRNGVPMYQVWLPNTANTGPILLPELLTRSAVESAFTQ